MDYTITVSNSFRVFGLEQATPWNGFNWGTGFWGYGTSTTALEIEKVCSESFTVTDTTELTVGYNVIIEASFEATGDLVSESMTDGAGYSYVFVKPTLDAEDRNLTAFTEVTNADESWVEQSDPTNTWSEE